MLLEPVTILSEKSASKWTDKDVMPLAELLAGRISIDASGENRQGANALGKIGPDLNKYIFTHPKIRSIMIPFMLWSTLILVFQPILIFALCLVLRILLQFHTQELIMFLYLTVLERQMMHNIS